MAIQFRCNYCKSLLGIADSQAGAAVDCPRCGRTQKVPGRSQRPAEGKPVPDLRLQQALTALSDLNTTQATSHQQSSDSAETEQTAVPVLLLDGLRDERAATGRRGRVLLASLSLVVFLCGFLTGRLFPFSPGSVQQTQPTEILQPPNPMPNCRIRRSRPPSRIHQTSPDKGRNLSQEMSAITAMDRSSQIPEQSYCSCR